MPNCKVSAGTRILVNQDSPGVYAGRELVVRKILEPTGGPDRGCKVVLARPPGTHTLDEAYFTRGMFTVLNPRRPDGCRP